MVELEWVNELELAYRAQIDGKSYFSGKWQGYGKGFWVIYKK